MSARRRGRRTGSILNRDGCIRLGQCSTLYFELKTLHIFINALLLQYPRRFAGKLRAIEVSAGGQTSGSYNKVPQRFSWKSAVNTCTGELAFKANELCLLSKRYANISLREDRYYVPGLQRQVLRRVMLQHQLTEIKRNKRSLERRRIHALNDGIVPIDFRGWQFYIGLDSR